MKLQLLQCMGITLLLSCMTASAQEKVPLNEPDPDKPRLFTDLPDAIPMNILDLQSMVNTPVGKDVVLPLDKSQASRFSGKVVSAASKYNNSIRSVVIRTSDFNGATLTLSSSIQSNGAVKFTGRIISLRHGDVYELEKRDEQYVLIKKNFYDLVNE